MNSQVLLGILDTKKRPLTELDPLTRIAAVIDHVFVSDIARMAWRTLDRVVHVDLGLGDRARHLQPTFALAQPGALVLNVGYDSRAEQHAQKRSTCILA
jgi:hypothetical protein